MPCFGADVGTVTLLDGKPRLLRGTAWFTLVEGVRIRDSDVIDVPEKAQLQLEMTDGGALSLIGPGALYVRFLTSGDAKQRALAEFWVTQRLAQDRYQAHRDAHAHAHRAGVGADGGCRGGGPYRRVIRWKFLWKRVVRRWSNRANPTTPASKSRGSDL